MGGRVWTLRLAVGRVEVRVGETATADAALRAEPKVLSALLEDPESLEAAGQDGSVTVAGDVAVIRRLLRAVTEPVTQFQ